jgi:hypothetical protein
MDTLEEFGVSRSAKEGRTGFHQHEIIEITRRFKSGVYEKTFNLFVALLP